LGFAIRLLLACSIGIWIGACDLSEPRKPDTLTFHLDDSLKTSSGKYDSIHLDLYTIAGRDTVYAGTFFRGLYQDSNQLRDLSLGTNLKGDFLVRVIAYRKGKPDLEVGIPFSLDGQKGVPIIFRAPAGDSVESHSPYIVSGFKDYSLNMGGNLRIILKAKDVDGDSIQVQIRNLDTLRALFPANAIQTQNGGDSLVIDFSPGPVMGNFRFQIVLLDPVLPSVVQTLIVSVGSVNRPPSISVLGPGPGPNYLLKEGETLSLKLAAQDPDPNDSAVLLSFVNLDWPSCGQGGYDTVSGVLSFRPSFRCVSTGEMTLSPWIFKAIDHGEPPEVGQTEVRITVRDSNSAPKWKTSSFTVSGKEGESMSLDLSEVYLGDDESDSVAFSASCGLVDAKSFRWTFTPGFRDAGTMDCSIFATDAHLPPAVGKLILKLTISDSIRPVDVAIISPIRGSATRDSLVVVKWMVGDQLQTQDTLEILHNEGANVIRRSYKDSGGLAGSDSIVVFRDTVPPLAPLLDSASLTPTNNPRPSWVWKSGGGRGSGSYRCKLGDTLWAANGVQGVANIFTPSSPLSEGKHTLYVEERDSVGNWSNPGIFPIETDYTPPSVPILNSTAGFHTLKPKPLWQWSSGGNGGNGTFRYKLNDADFSIGANITQVNSYTPSLAYPVGTRHTLFVQERDEAGNWSEAASYSVWVHGLDGYGVSGAGILRTKDGGASWDTVSRPSKIQLNSSWFHDIYNGFVVGDSGVIFKTNSGGQDWQKVPSGTMQDLHTIFFPKRESPFIGTSGGLISSKDGGNSWIASDSKYSTAIFSIHFSTSANGIAVGAGTNGTKGSIIVTADSGKTWNRSVEEAGYGLISAYAVDPKTMVCVGKSGSILRTNDSGKTWNEMNSGTSVYLQSIFFLNPTLGFASGGSGTLVKTVDGGKNWTPVSVEYTGDITQVFFLDENLGIATGNGDVLRTVDGGVSWNKVHLPDWVDYPLPQYPDVQIFTQSGCSQVFFP
jgi:photosystem II stability/assembly factor-like uncharacterized protein